MSVPAIAPLVPHIVEYSARKASVQLRNTLSPPRQDKKYTKRRKLNERNNQTFPFHLPLPPNYKMATIIYMLMPIMGLRLQSGL